MDVDNIPLGADFVETIESAVQQCDVLLALISRSWSADQRYAKSNDFVRIEIAAALRRNIPVVPVLFDGADLPSSEQLPADLKPLLRRQAHQIRHTSFHGDVDRLITGLTSLNVRNLQAKTPLAVDAYAGELGTSEQVAWCAWDESGLGPVSAGASSFRTNLPISLAMIDARAFRPHDAEMSRKAIASIAAISRHQDGHPPDRWSALSAAASRANSAISTTLDQRPELKGIGCPFVALTIDDNGLRWLSAGDCLIFLLRAGQLQLNEDHSIRSELMAKVAQGQMSMADLRAHPNLYALRSALAGGSELPKVLDRHTSPLELEKNDWLLIGSHRIKYILDTELRHALAKQCNENPRRMIEFVRTEIGNRMKKQKALVVVAIKLVVGERGV